MIGTYANELAPAAGSCHGGDIETGNMTMGLAKYRADKSEKCADGSTVWRAIWIGGPSLSKIENCRVDSLAGDMRATVYVQGEADSWFSIPAKCYLCCSGLYRTARRNADETSEQTP